MIIIGSRSFHIVAFACNSPNRVSARSVSNSIRKLSKIRSAFNKNVFNSQIIPATKKMSTDILQDTGKKFNKIKYRKVNLKIIRQ